MKKTIALLLLCAMLLSCFAGCGVKQGSVTLSDYAQNSSSQTLSGAGENVGSDGTEGYTAPTSQGYSPTATELRTALSNADATEGKNTEWYSDTGTSFELSTAAQLRGFFQLRADGKTFEGKTITLSKDIDLGTTGAISRASGAFKGIFNGNNHVISGITLTVTGSGSVSLFGEAGAKAEIRNLSIINSSVNVTMVSDDATDISEYTDNQKKTRAANFSKIGGLFHYAAASNDSDNPIVIDHVYADIDITARCAIPQYTIEETNINAALYLNAASDMTAQSVGGFIGRITSGGYVDITNSVYAGTITSSMSEVAGFVGRSHGATTLTISNCKNIGSMIVMDKIFVGGSNENYGQDRSDGTNTFVATEVDVTNAVAWGGFVGKIYGGNSSSLTLTNSTNAAQISGYQYVGGMIGMRNGSAVIVRIDKCINEGAISATKTQAAGFYGHVSEAGTLTLTNSKNIGTISATSYVGGFVGNYETKTAIVTTIENCLNAGNITASSNSAGGFIGRLATASSASGNSFSISNCENTGIIRASTATGGIIGYIPPLVKSSTDNTPVSINTTVSNCKNTGKINNSNNSAGIVGQFDNSGTLTITNCSVDFTLTDAGRSGGIIGMLGNQTGTDPGTRAGNVTVSNCSVNLAQTSTGGHNGGVIAKIWWASDVTVENCEVEGNVQVASNSAGGVIGYATYVDSLTITNCKNSATLSASEASAYVGGMIGRVNNCSSVVVSSCVNDGAISLTGKNHVAGIIGYVSAISGDVTVEGCQNNAAITGASGIAGICGAISGTPGNIALTGNTNNGVVTGTTKIGGVSGNVNGITGNVSLQGNTNTASVSGTTHTAGISGYINNIAGNVSLQGNTNTASVSGTTEIGGVSGNVDGIIGTVSLQGNTNTASVTGTTHTAGIAGYIYNITGNVLVDDCDVTLDSNEKISGSSTFGGIVGTVDKLGGADNVISNCDFVGVVEGSIYQFGGILGYANAYDSNKLLTVSEANKLTLKDCSVKSTESVTSYVKPVEGTDLTGDNGRIIGGAIGYIKHPHVIIDGFTFDGQLIAGRTSGAVVGSATADLILNNGSEQKFEPILRLKNCHVTEGSVLDLKLIRPNDSINFGGGLIGQSTADTYIADSSFAGVMTVEMRAVGYTKDGKTVVAPAYAGMLIGSSGRSLTAENCTVTGTMNVTDTTADSLVNTWNSETEANDISINLKTATNYASLAAGSLRPGESRLYNLSLDGGKIDVESASATVEKSVVSYNQSFSSRVIGYQVRENGDKIDLRYIAAINGDISAYNAAGFKVTLQWVDANGELQTYNTVAYAETVYKTIVANDGEKNVYYNASDFMDANYLYALVITNVPASYMESNALKNLEISIVPFLTTDENSAADYGMDAIHGSVEPTADDITDVPALEGAEKYDAGVNDTSYVLALENASKDDYDNYKTALAAAGYTMQGDEWTQTFDYVEDYETVNTTYDPGAKNSGTGLKNYYSIYTKGDAMVYVYFCEGTKTMRVVVADIAEYYAYQNAQDTENSQGDFEFAMIDLGREYGTGLCIVIQLADGRFVVIDGGYNGTWYDSEGDRLYNWMADRTEGKVTVAAWIFTHVHGDHVKNALDFEERYGHLATIENYMYNFPTNEYVWSFDGSDLQTKLYTQLFANLENVTSRHGVIVPHTGMSYQFANCKIEILYTHEDYYPAQPLRYNNNSTCFKITMNGETSFIVAGDMEEAVQTDLTKQVGTLLCADYVQVTHHGANGTEEFYKYCTSGGTGVALWPNNSSTDQTAVGSKWIKNNYVAYYATMDGSISVKQDGKLYRYPSASYEADGAQEIEN